MAFGGSGPAPVLLNDGATRETVALECRSAALDFMSGVGHGWTKLELVRWLIGPYANAVRHGIDGERTPAVPSKRRRGAVRPETIEELLVATRGKVLAALEKAALGDGMLDFVEDALEHDFVHRAFGEDGREVWIPMDRPRMRLRDRVEALFSADYLNDPVGYGSLYVCHRCEAVVFDAHAREAGMCSAHSRVSGIVMRNDDTAIAVGDE
jgi:hypothetical protein